MPLMSSSKLFLMFPTYEVHTISFQPFYFSYGHLWDDWQNFMISGSKEQQLKYTRLKPDCHKVNLKNAIWLLKEWYAIKKCFKLGKSVTETYGMLQTAFGAWIEHQFLSDIRESRKFGSLWEMMRGVGGVRKSIHQCWLAKGLGLGWGLGLLCWGFKEVQEEIPSEEVSNLQIGSVAFPPGQCTSPQLHPCHWLFDRDGHQDSYPPSL